MQTKHKLNRSSSSNRVVVVFEPRPTNFIQLLCKSMDEVTVYLTGHLGSSSIDGILSMAL